MKNLVQELTFLSYACQRDSNPEISPERWAKVYQNVPELESRYQAERGNSGRGSRDHPRGLPDSGPAGSVGVVSLTPEARAKALESRKAKLAASAHFKRDWLDSDLWDSLAKSNGIRLPLWSKRPTPRFLKRWHETLDTGLFEDVYGCKPARLIALNQHTPLRAFVGMMLERA